MANSQIKTRIIHKHDTAANWELAVNFIPKQGEIIIYDKDSTYNYERFKIGDGATLVSALPFANDALKAEIQTLLNDKASVSSVTQLSNKLDGIATGAEVNQNAFSNVTVGSTTISADSKTDTLTIVAGSNITLTPDATNDKITIIAKDTTYDVVTTSAAGLMSADDKANLNAAVSKLDGIASGAQVNQNAFSNITDGTTTIAADSTTDTLTLTAGSNISLALDATNDKVTISATNTTYGAADSSLGLVKSGGDVTISSGTITVNDDSHNHVISNVDGLQNALDAKADKSDYETFKTNVNTLLDSDDETLDQMSEIVAYTKNNKGLIDSITTSKQDKITGAATTITSSNLTASRVLVSDSNGKVAASSSITTTELGYLDGATSNLQTQITAAKNTADAKLAAADITVTVTGTGNAITAASYDDNGTITLTKGATYNNYTYTLPIAKYNTLGGVKPAYTSTGAATLTTTAATNTTTPTIAAKTTTSGRYYGVEADQNGVLFVNVPWTDTNTDTNTTYSAGTGLSLTGTTFSVKTGYTTSGKNYKVQADSNGNLYVNVPWADNNTTYSASTGLSLSGTAFSLAASGVTAGSYGPTGNVSGSNGATITVPQITVDTYGRVTSVTNRTYTSVDTNTDTNTHYTTRIYAGASGTAANAAATNPYLKVTDDNTYRNQVRFVGSGATTVSSDANGNITISSTDTNTNTDTKVTQSRSTATSYRPLLLHNLYADYGTDVGQVTDLVYYNETIAAKASTGELRATSFVGSGASLTSLNASNISSGTIAAARLPAATASAKGGVIVGSNITVSSGTISLTKDNVVAALGYTPPTSDTNTTYSAGTGLTLSGTIFSLSTVPVTKGGTGSTSKSGARTNLGISSGTSLPSSGTAGDIFFLYS